MIAISEDKNIIDNEKRKRQRVEQSLDTKNILNIIQSKSKNDPHYKNLIYTACVDIEDEELSSLIQNFTKRYSSIATERLLNYHLGTKAKERKND